GRCEEALAFYKKAIGAETVMVMRYGECPESHQNPNAKDDDVMHASVKVGNTTFMASDGHCLGKPEFKGFSLSLTVADEAEAKRSFEALSDGGQVIMPLGKTFFSPAFGMLADRFGVSWMVYVEQH